MARTERARTIRQKDDFRQGRRDVVLQEGRRFFTARGGDDAERSARALKNALGVGLEAYEGKLARDNTKGGSRAAQEAAAGGDRDVTDSNKGYNDAFDQVEAANDLAIFANELPELLTKEGWADLDEPVAQARIDTYFAGQLKGINPDSVYGKIVAEGILQQNAKLLAVHRGFKSEQAQQERRVMIDNELNADYKDSAVTDEFGNVTRTLDHDKLMGRLLDLVPGPGGRATYVEAVLDLAEEFGDQGPIDSMPDRFPNGEPTGKTDPNLDDMFDGARTRAESKRQKNLKKAEDDFNALYQTERAQAHSNLTTRAKAGDTGSYPDIEAGGKDGPNGEPRLLSRPQQKLLYDQLNAAQLGAESSRVDANLFGTGRAFGMNEADYDNAAISYAANISEMFKQGNTDWDDERIAAETLKVVIERSFQHDRIPKYIADFLNATPANPERFKEAVNVKAMVDAYDPSWFQRTVSDRNAAIMDSYEMSLVDTGNEESALEFVGQYDETLYAGRGKEITEIAEIALEALANDKPFWGDYPITIKDQQRAEKLTKHYVALGYRDDRIAGFVENGMRNRNVRVNGVMYPIDSGWIKGDDAVETYLESVAASEYFAKPEDMVIKPHRTKHGVVVVQDSTAMLPYSSPEVKISEIEAFHARRQDELFEDFLDNSNASTSDRMKIADERAYHKAFPNMLILQGQDAGQRKAWLKYDPEKKRRLIEAELN